MAQLPAGHGGPKTFVPSPCQYPLTQQLLIQHLPPVPGSRFGGFTWEENRQSPHPCEACSLLNVGGMYTNPEETQNYNSDQRFCRRVVAF